MLLLNEEHSPPCAGTPHSSPTHIHVVHHLPNPKYFEFPQQHEFEGVLVSVGQGVGDVGAQEFWLLVEGHCIPNLANGQLVLGQFKLFSG